ncbi:hypothetical protein QL093DRAFT_2510428, partial [Fusarium oxysporum]
QSRHRIDHTMKRPFESTQTDYTAATGRSETTPWLQHTRWAELFRNRSIEIIAATAKLSASQWSRKYLHLRRVTSICRGWGKVPL